MQKLFYYSWAFFFALTFLQIAHLPASTFSEPNKNVLDDQIPPELVQYTPFFNSPENIQTLLSLDPECASLTAQMNEATKQQDQPIIYFSWDDDLKDKSYLSEELLLNEIESFSYLGYFWQKLTQAFYSCFRYLERPQPKWKAPSKLSEPVSKALEKMGKDLVGEPSYLLLGNNFEETRIDTYGKHEVHDKVRVTFINGILTNSSMMNENLRSLSNSHGGINIHYLFRPTEGWTRDIWRGMMIKTAFSLGFRSIHAYLLANMWKELIQEMGGTEGGGLIVHYAHSLGGTETDRARDLLSADEQKMIRVITFGSCTFIRDGGFESVTNVVSANDGVASFFLEPIGNVHNYFNPQSNVRFYTFPESSCWPIDHLLSGHTYTTLFKEFGNQFLKEFVLKNKNVGAETSNFIINY